MNDIIINICTSFLAFLFTGIIAGAIYDIFSFCEIYFKIATNNSKVPWALTFNRDVSFVIVLTIIFIITLYYRNNGEMRGLFLVFFCLGIYLYKILLRSFLIKILKFITSILQNIVTFLFLPIAKIIFRMYNKSVKNLMRQKAQKSEDL